MTGPLNGLRIIDLTNVWVGPQAMRTMAEMGAEVIKVESWRRMDTSRGDPKPRPGTGSYADNFPGPRPWHRTPVFNEKNLSKQDICLDLQHPKGVETLKRLVAISDIVVENFRVGAVDRLGVGYEDLKKVKPDLVMISIASQGLTGPESGYVSFGSTLEQLAGVASITGYRGSHPMASNTFYPDPFVATVIPGVILAAIRQRNRTGQGTYIDYSQRETVTSIIGEHFMDYSMNGREGEPRGNRDLVVAPQGVYRCSGDDMWLAMTVRTDAEWQALCSVMDRSDLANNPEHASVVGRQRDHDLIDDAITFWTQGMDAFEAMRLLLRAGIPAGVVQKGSHLLADPQLVSRHFFETLEHPEAGKRTYIRLPFQLTKTPGGVRSHAPLLGEHTEHVLRNIVGLTEAEVQELAELGVTGTHPLGAPPVVE